MENKATILRAYGTWIEDLIEVGFKPFFVTFMFNPLPGSTGAKWEQMQKAIDGVYGRVLIRTFRAPNASKYDGQRPVLIVAPDFPVFKYAKDTFADVAINDGLHAHGLWLMPEKSRMEEDLSGHFLNYGRRYVGQGRAIQRIKCDRITETPAHVADYVIKSVKSGRVSMDEITVWPRGK